MTITETKEGKALGSRTRPRSRLREGLADVALLLVGLPLLLLAALLDALAMRGRD